MAAAEIKSRKHREIEYLYCIVLYHIHYSIHYITPVKDIAAPPFNSSPVPASTICPPAVLLF